ncbi:uncharacterized protein Z520_09422 [Fonsecaea multimorphosa CBS 102226]|uniref:MGS207 protein n=1 Tax=Fonsecaea multimorphosa CBS 102226 TaxID=1442371 RepID=A0A0D2JN07_9EURO|nr:uncharacterized protein Z520_09422 [Fonsecaea multimorphosa CBS 102226]KIX94732.1 hypothetical protein Z520_09422 [Fonsecaea multimorphosa CBS 102226]OAL20506.1 hypothetical protein AYO22_08807 [Fonsecaea multimorphosa]
MSNTVTTTVSTGEAVRLPPPTNKTSLEPAPVYDVSKLSDDRTQTLRRLLEQGHAAVAPLRNPQLILHSHLPHLLGSAYALGADAEQLTRTYKHDIETLVKIDESFIRGDKVTRENWREFLGNKEYTVAYVDFFDDEVRRNGGDWEKVVHEYLYSGAEPLINGFCGGLGHPFIHLAYGYEFRIPEVVTQALSLGCTEYVVCHGLLDNPPPIPSPYKTRSLAEVIRRVQKDPRFDGIVEFPGTVNFGTVLQHRFEAFMEHWNAWEVTDPVQQFEQCCDLSVVLAISPTEYGPGKYDFFYAHIMTVAHALRILFHEFPADRRVSILRQYAFFTILIYILQNRLSFGIERIESVVVDTGSGGPGNWDAITQRALKHRWALDDHFFKVVRAIKAFAETYGDKDGFYLKAATKYVTDFNGWEGFGEGIMGFLPSRDGYIPA